MPRSAHPPYYNSMDQSPTTAYDNMSTDANYQTVISTCYVVEFFTH